MHRAKKYCCDDRFEGNVNFVKWKAVFRSMGHFWTYVLQANGYTVQFGHLVIYLDQVTFALFKTELYLL